MSVLAVVENPSGISLEALAAATKIGDIAGLPVSAAVLGADVEASAAKLLGYGVPKVWVLSDALLAPYTPDAYTSALEQLIKAHQPKIVVFPHTYQVRDYAPKLATRFGTVLIGDVIDVTANGDQIGFVRQLFQGKLNQEVHSTAAVQFVSVQAGAFRPAESAAASGAVEAFPIQLDAPAIRTKPEERFRESTQTVDLGAASVIVSVGRGIKEKDNLGIAEELAAVLGAELAASRPICDNGWLPIERQVGSSGQTVAPKIYFAIGISGAIQHIVGMKGSKTIVAINKDENAPIFESADYGIADDLFDVVPALVEELKKTKS